jgi:hypothetical protein
VPIAVLVPGLAAGGQPGKIARDCGQPGLERTARVGPLLQERDPSFLRNVLGGGRITEQRERKAPHPSHLDPQLVGQSIFHLHLTYRHHESVGETQTPAARKTPSAILWLRERIYYRVLNLMCCVTAPVSNRAPRRTCARHRNLRWSGRNRRYELNMKPTGASFKNGIV